MRQCECKSAYVRASRSGSEYENGYSLTLSDTVKALGHMTVPACEAAEVDQPTKMHPVNASLFARGGHSCNQQLQPDAGHSAAVTEPGISRALMAAADKFATIHT